MAHVRRKLSAFSLSFLDIMSCGFGAVVLLFLIIKHNVDANEFRTTTVPDLASEVNMLEEEILEGKLGLAKLRNTIDEIDQEVVTAQGLASRIMEDIEETAGNAEEYSTDSQSAVLEKLKADLKKLEAERQRLEEETDNTGTDTRSFIGKGNREYLTGIKLGGKRILVLFDTSASMLDKTIVNIIRRRNMSDARKKSADKWQQALETVDWISTRFPQGSQYQIYTFNTSVEPVLKGTRDKWLNVKDLEKFNEAIEQLKKIVPQGGTSLEKAFIAAAAMRPLPDNIFLITDGLPTQGQKPPRGTTISGKDRLKLFENAIKRLPQGIPVNVILSPMEGDPMAASAFWQLAQLTKGSFMSPTDDWP